MPYAVLEEKFRSLPQQSFEEVSDFFDYILYKFGEKSKVDDVDEELVEKINAACKKVPQEKIDDRATVSAMWEAVKNDSW